MIAYHSDESGNPDIWVAQVGIGQAVNRTADSADDRFPRWSPDGQWISFYSDRDGGGWFVMPAVGGTARKIAPLPQGAIGMPAEWSPDSRQVAYVLGQAAKPWIEILTLADRASKKLPLPVKPLNNRVVGLAWSPDGRWIAYDRAIAASSATSELWLTRVDNGESIQLTDGIRRDWRPAWPADSRSLYFVSNRGGTQDLWRFILHDDGRPQGPPQQVSMGVEMQRAALSPDGKKLAFARGRRVANIYRAPLLADRPATWADATQLTFDEAENESIDVSGDGRLVVGSDRLGNWGLWTLPSAGGDLRRLTTDAAMDAFSARWSPDGHDVVFVSTRSGHREVWTMPAEGGPARQLTRDEFENIKPDYSPAGDEIVKEEHGRGLGILSLSDGRTRRLTEGTRDGTPDWSPDGRWVAFDSDIAGVNGIWRVPASGGPTERLTDGEDFIPRWSGDGKQIFFCRTIDRANQIWALSLDSRRTRPVTALTGRRGVMPGTSLAVDEKSIYFNWLQTRAEIWVADIVEPQH
jgi:Tol biopolymer transport system component